MLTSIELQKSIENLESASEIMDVVWHGLRPNDCYGRWDCLTSSLKNVLLARLSCIQGDFADWRGTYERLTYRNYFDVRVLILEKMFITAKTSADWRFLFTKSTPIEKRQCQILENLIDAADNIDDVFFARENIGENLILKERAEQKILKLCITFELCLQALKKCGGEQSDFTQKIVRRSDKTIVSFENLCYAKKYHFRNLFVRALIISKFSKLKTSLENWITLLNSTSENCPLRSVIMLRLKESCTQLA
ncbi:MAG TPA: hypothetical protein DIC35_02175 [Candidatus Moranbacteria bacterium]|nr:hypothetical protein [Candidatus Moranbacteria bacterium]